MVVNKCLEHWLHRGLSRGWEKWIYYAANVRHMRTIMTKCLDHMLHRELSRGFVEESLTLAVPFLLALHHPS